MSIHKSLQVEINLMTHVISLDLGQPKYLVRLVAIQKDQTQDPMSIYKFFLVEIIPMIHVTSLD